MHALTPPSAVQRTPPQHWRRQRLAGVCRCGAPPDPVSEQTEPGAAATEAKGGRTVNRVNLFDPAATLSRLITRRFGFVGGLAFVGILAATEGGAIFQAVLEDVNTKEVELGTPTTWADGLVGQDVKIGGGSSPSAGDFVGAHFKVTAQAPGDAEPSVLLDTRATGRPIAWVFNKPRRAAGELRGVEEGIATMKRGGVRVLTFPTGMGLGAPLGGLPGPLPGLRVEVEITEVSPAYFAS